MPALPAGTFLTVGSPYDSAVQLIYKLPGKYRLIRHTHHPQIVRGTNLLYGDLIKPSHGTSEIVFCASTDSQYEVELMQTTTITLRTFYGQTANVVERRAFRIKNGRWSLWGAYSEEGVDRVLWKLADLELCEVEMPKRGGPTEADAAQKAVLKGGSWEDGWGMNALVMCVWMGTQPCWQSSHRIDRQEHGASEVCSDEFWPVVEDGGM